MKKLKQLTAMSLLLVFAIMACQRVPLTNRKQFVGLVSQEQMLQLSFAEYKGFLDTSKVLPANTQQSEMVSRVGSRIKDAVETFLIQNNYGSMIDGYKWEFRTVQSPQINAWAMPGGKVCFYTGILPICQDDAGVAVVMGHEVAHAIASHGRERLSNALAAQGITQVGAIAAGVYTGDQRVMQTVGQVLGIGSNVGYVLPNSRKQESEADKLGVIFMAMAGYDPQVAVEFWKRMAQASANSQKPPQFLSTHPADQQRIDDLQKMMPKALSYYEAYMNK